MMGAFAIGGKFFVDFFASLGFVVHEYAGECSEAVKFAESNASPESVFALSGGLEPTCLGALISTLEKLGASYVVLPELSEASKESVDELYDRIIKSIIGT